MTPAQQREETWMMVEKFAGFGFCKAHAATYAGYFLYRMAYLKTHHPAEFLAAMCSAGAGLLPRVGVCGRGEALGDRRYGCRR